MTILSQIIRYFTNLAHFTMGNYTPSFTPLETSLTDIFAAYHDRTAFLGNKAYVGLKRYRIPPFLSISIKTHSQHYEHTVSQSDIGLIFKIGGKIVNCNLIQFKKLHMDKVTHNNFRGSYWMLNLVQFFKLLGFAKHFRDDIFYGFYNPEQERFPDLKYDFQPHDIQYFTNFVQKCSMNPKFVKKWYPSLRFVNINYIWEYLLKEKFNKKVDMYNFLDYIYDYSRQIPNNEIKFDLYGPFLIKSLLKKSSTIDPEFIKICEGVKSKLNPISLKETFKEYFPHGYERFINYFDKEMNSLEEQKLVHQVCQSIYFEIDRKNYLELQKWTETIL